MSAATRMGCVAKAALMVVTLAMAACGGSLDDEPVEAEAAAAPATAAPAASSSQVVQTPSASTPAVDAAEMRRQPAALRGEVAQLQRRLGAAEPASCFCRTDPFLPNLDPGVSR